MPCRAQEQFLALYKNYAAHHSKEGKFIPDSENIMDIIRTLASDFFVLDKTAGNQPEAERRLSIQIQKLYPDFPYELVQFGTRYGKSNFNKHRTNRLKSRIKIETNYRTALTSGPTATVKISKRRLPNPQATIKKASRRSVSSPLTPLPTTPSSQVPKKVINQSLMSPQPKVVTNIIRATEHVSEGDDHDAVGIDDIRCFLLSCKPNMIHLLDCLVNVGFRNAEYLQEASKLSRRDLDELFRNMDGITRLDAMFLQRHLLSLFVNLNGGPSSHHEVPGLSDDNPNNTGSGDRT